MYKYKILCIEDDEDLLYLIKEILEQNNFEVDAACTGKDALEKMYGSPDLILLDLALPDMDGLEVCKSIRQDEALNNIPIVILSGKNSIVDKIDGVYFGADDYITKPFDGNVLIGRIKKIIDRLNLQERLSVDQSDLLFELKNIIEHKLVIPYFQPIFSLSTLYPIGFEAFSRAPQDSALSNPDFLFKVALSVGMYFDLEMLCWNKAFSKWESSSVAGKLFLNANPYLIESGNFTNVVLANQGITINNMVLEITERATIQDYNLLTNKLMDLRKIGLKVAIDDVGCGFSSLTTLAGLKPDFLKIDIPIVRNIHQDETKQDMVRAITFFARRSNVSTIAEGIEHEGELDKLIELGVDAGQGYLLAKPEKEVNIKCTIKR